MWKPRESVRRNDGIFTVSTAVLRTPQGSTVSQAGAAYVGILLGNCMISTIPIMNVFYTQRFPLLENRERERDRQCQTPCKKGDDVSWNGRGKE